VTDVYSIEDQVLEEMDMQVIAAELGKMDEETKYIISEYLGFNGEKHRSFLDIAGDLGVSRSTVSRAYNAAIEQIRGALGIKVTDGVMQPAV
jgi:DNA-directed RNA polymerase specialized sigma subunit